MGLQPSASKTGLLLACQRPFDPALALEADPPEEPARYGSAFHVVIADVLTGKLPDKGPRYDKAIDKAAHRWGVRPAAEELAAHVRSSSRYLLKFFAEGGWNLKTLKVETSYAIPVADDKPARRIEAPSEEEHRYAGLREGEIAATLDVEITSKDSKHVMLGDHKTGYLAEDHYSGESFALPATLPQMKTIGLVTRSTKTKKRKTTTLAIFHFDRAGLPDIHFDRYEEVDAQEHRRRLAIALLRVGDGSLRPGPQCNVCPAASSCPARAADIMGAASSALLAAGAERLQTVNDNFSTLPVGVRAGRLMALTRRLEKVTEMARAEVRRLVEAGEVVEEPDGTTYELSHEFYETLSKASVIRALGKTAGERALARMRKQGLVEEKERVRLLPRRPK